MIRINAYHEIDTDTDHYRKVLEDMRRLGAPTIRAVFIFGIGLVALEGCHRLAAAEELGLVPEIEILEDELPEDLSHDLDGMTLEEVSTRISDYPYDVGAFYRFE